MSRQVYFMFFLRQSDFLMGWKFIWKILPIMQIGYIIKLSMN